MRGAIVLLAGLAFAAPATAAPPSVAVSTTPSSGAAPLRVTLRASGDAAAYSWDLGDGSAASGAVVAHAYPAGRFLATVTATSATGEVAQAQIEIAVARRTLALASPRAADYGSSAALTGSLLPAARGARVLLRSPGPYHARWGELRSAVRAIVVRPRLEASLPQVAPVGGALAIKPRLEPAAAGSLRIRVLRAGAVVSSRAGRIPTGIPGRLRVELTSTPRVGYAPVRRVLSVQVVHPSLAPGARGQSVRALERRLAELHYALRGVGGVYGHDTFEAVLAFQKVSGLPRTGRVEPWLWQRLARAGVPRAARGGDYIEVDKTRQILFVVRAGTVAKILHVSAGATGNTPIGSWQVYRKVPGWDWVLWYPLYFKGGFAIHGYPSVPAYPASPGCVRIPMWFAPSLYGSHDYGTTVVIHL